MSWLRADDDEAEAARRQAWASSLNDRAENLAYEIIANDPSPTLLVVRSTVEVVLS